MNKMELIQKLSGMINDDPDFCMYADQRARSTLASRDIQVPEDTSNFEPYWELVSAYGLEVLVGVLNNFVPHD
jgi:hypothetical protein